MVEKRVHVLEQTVMLGAPLAKVFDFFSKSENLEKLTPPSLKFTILTPSPIEMRAGTKIDYKLTLMGVSFKWKTEISIWEPPHKFADDQMKGPYEVWFHTHTFEAVGDQTKMSDQVQFRSPGFFLEPIVHNLFVKPQVKGIFEFRNKVMGEIFGIVETTPITFTERIFVRPN